MRYLALLALVLLAPFAAHAQQNGNPRTYAPTLATFMAKRGDILDIRIDVQAGLNDANPQWQLKNPLFDVMIDRLILAQKKTATEADNVWKKAAVREPNYRGIMVRIQLTENDKISPFTVFKGNITNSRGKVVLTDPGRTLEYWLMGTARIKRDQLLAVSVLPILSFEQCRLLGNQIVDTTPRQCLLVDGNILLETSEQPTASSLKATDFDTCLKYGKALIQTFPRRCMAAGGRVFTEPPRVYEPPADAPLAQGISNTMGGLPVSATGPLLPAGVSLTQPHDEVVGRTGLGRYTIPVSGSALPSLPPAAPEQAPPLPPLPADAQTDVGQPHLRITSGTLLPGGPVLGVEQPRSVMPAGNPDHQLVPPVQPASKTVVLPGTGDADNRFAPGSLPPLTPRLLVTPPLPAGVEPAPSRGTITPGPGSSAVDNAQTGPY